MVVPEARYQCKKSILGHPWDLLGHWPSFHNFGAQVFLPQGKDALGSFLPLHTLPFLPFPSPPLLSPFLLSSPLPSSQLLKAQGRGKGPRAKKGQEGPRLPASTFKAKLEFGTQE